MMLDLKQKMKTYKDLMNVQYPNNVTDNPNDTYKNFAKYLDSDRDARPLEVPDYLKCPITDDLMEEPVVIQSGHTYEKDMITKHFKTNGGFDPITRQEVDITVLIPNLMLKKASQEYLTQNPWAYQHMLNDDYNSILM